MNHAKEQAGDDCEEGTAPRSHCEATPNPFGAGAYARGLGAGKGREACDAAGEELPRYASSPCAAVRYGNANRGNPSYHWLLLSAPEMSVHGPCPPVAGRGIQFTGHPVLQQITCPGIS